MAYTCSTSTNDSSSSNRLRKETVLEQVLKAERKRDNKPGSSKRKAKSLKTEADEDEESGLYGEKEKPAKKRREESSEPETGSTKSEPSVASSMDTIARLLQQLQLPSQAQQNVPGAVAIASAADDPRALERARIKEEKEAKKAEKKERQAFAKAEAAAKRGATQDLGLAAKAQVILVPVADSLKAIEINDALEAVVREPLEQAKASIAQFLKEATALQAAAKKKGFGSSQEHRLGWTQKDISAAVTSAKDAMKKHETFMRMFRS